MKVCVLGAGIVGVQSARALQQRGCDVVLVDRLPVPAGATSKGNASLLTPGHCEAWNEPGALWLLARAWLQRDPVMTMQVRQVFGGLGWNLRFLANCMPAGVARRNRALETAAINSTRLIVAQCRELDFISAPGEGVVYLFGSEREYAREQALVRKQPDGLDPRPLNQSELFALEPALSRRAARLAGALFEPRDQAINCPAFATRLVQQLEHDGATLLLGREVTGVRRTGDRIDAMLTDQGEIVADTYVVAFGPWAGQFLAGHLDVRLPIAPVKGYSMTLRMHSGEQPRIGGVDMDDLVTFAPHEGYLRTTCYAHFAGFDTTIPPGIFARHRRSIEKNLPGLVDWDDERQEWTGLRPASPDGLPTVDRLPGIRNGFVNGGHGYLGWTLSADSAALLADMITGAGDVRAEFAYRW